MGLGGDKPWQAGNGALAIEPPEGLPEAGKRIAIANRENAPGRDSALQLLDDLESQCLVTRDAGRMAADGRGSKRRGDEPAMTLRSFGEEVPAIGFCRHGHEHGAHLAEDRKSVV